MSVFKRLLKLINGRPTSRPKTYEISESLLVTLKTLAEHEGRSEHDLIPDLLAAGLHQYRATEEPWAKWESLSPREQDVAALTCLKLTNRQIAARLSLSPETIKTHMRNVLFKFGLNSKEELRHILAGWDFSGWM